MSVWIFFAGILLAIPILVYLKLRDDRKLMRKIIADFEAEREYQREARQARLARRLGIK